MSADPIALYYPVLNTGGVERIILNLARGFLERGRRVDVVLRSGAGSHMSEISPQARVVVLPRRRAESGGVALGRYLRAERPGALLASLAPFNLTRDAARGGRPGW